MSLVVDSVSVIIGAKQILTDVNLDVADHEVVSILGPSGSGKTTLLRVIAGLQAPTTGSVTLDGVDITARPAHRRGIGFMFQDHALFPHRTVYGNVAFGLRMARHPRAEIGPRVDEVLELVGLAGFGSRSIDGLSGGERQRVALARALAPGPGLLLLDEPLGSLDRALRDRLVVDLAEVIRSSGVSAIYVTHDQAEAFAMGNRLAVMRNGTFAQVGSPEQLWTAPTDSEVARIVGPVSLVPVEVDATGAVPAPWQSIVATVLAPAGEAYVVVRTDTFSLAGPQAEVAATTSVPDDRREPVLSAEVVEVTFRGDHRLVTARLIGLSEPTSAPDVQVAHRGPEPIRKGDQVQLRVQHRPAVVPPPL